MPATFYLIRHGESTLNAAGVKYGSLNPPLTPCGRKQTHQVAERLHGQVESIVSSPLTRALEFATALAILLQLPQPIVLENLRERTFGDAEGMTPDMINHHWPTGDIPGMETVNSAAARATQTLNQLEGHVAVVTHAGVIRGLTGQRARNGDIVTICGPL